jgi:hypothetical protein
LRIVPVSDLVSGSKPKAFRQTAAHTDDTAWRERDFARNISPEWPKELLRRTVVVAKKDDHRASSPGQEKPAISPESREDDVIDLSKGLASVQEKEPNEKPSEAQELPTRCIIDGIIGHPGDVDYFKFNARPGARLAFEIQTVDTQPPLLNPELEVLDANEQELLTNIYKFEVQDAWARSLEPKIIYTFDRGGEYYLKIHDLAARHGGTEFKYRLLIRPQVPHIGDLEVKQDCINLVSGETKKLTITTAQEEGFRGEIAVAVEDLPQGVQAFPAVEAEPTQGGSPREKIHPERFLPNTQTVTIALRATEDAPPTPTPRLIKVKAWPIVGGRSGAPLPAGQILLMVLQIPH